jgi:AraC-like DNA-binding protein
MSVAERAILVPDALRSWISGISVATIGVEHDRQTVIDEPDTATTLAFRMNGRGRGDLVVLGPRTHALYHLGEPGPSCVTLRIRRGRAGLLLGRSASDFVDRVIPLADIWGDAGDRLARVLDDHGSDRDRLVAQPVLDRLEGALLSRPSAGRDGDPSRADLVHTATRVLSADADLGPEPVRAAARRLNVSERQLRNLFANALGVSPKHFARIDRVRTVLARARHEDLARLATEAGYYDQSHMTAEFRHVMGVTPGAFLAGRLPAAARCNRYARSLAS